MKTIMFKCETVSVLTSEQKERLLVFVFDSLMM